MPASVSTTLRVERCRSRHAQLLFQRLHLRADGGAGHAEFLCRLGEAQVLADGEKGGDAFKRIEGLHGVYPTMMLDHRSYHSRDLR